MVYGQKMGGVKLQPFDFNKIVSYIYIIKQPDCIKTARLPNK